MEPPLTIRAGDYELRRWEPQDAGALADAVRESLPELRLFLAWAHDDYGPGDAAGFLEVSGKGWAERTDFNYAVLAPDGTLAGSVSLMTRLGPGTLEIGYWARTSHAGRGLMTTAVVAVTEVALGLPGVERAVIRYDAVNHASAAVARKAGFTEVVREFREPTAPGETTEHVVSERRR